MKKAVIYARYSSDSQTEQSIEGQLRVCEEYAERNGIVILDTYIDRAMSGTNDNRPDFQRMIKNSAKKEWDFVLVYKLDRFSRNKYETTLHKHTLSTNGVKVLSAMENIPDTPEGIILESLLEGMNQYYSAELSQKVKRGMNETRLKGNFTGGIMIYGYRVENGKVIVNEDQAEVIRYIYKQYSLGVYVKDIIKELNKQNISNRGKPFTKSTIYKILKNEKYSGIYRHENQVFDNIYPQIVSFETYDVVRKKTEQNKHGKRSTRVLYILRNKLKCAYCDRPISAETGTSSSGKRIHYYKCLGRKSGNGCTQPMVRQELFEEFIVNTIVKVLSKPKYIEEIIKGIIESQKKLGDNNSYLTNLSKERNQAEKSLNNIMLAVENGLMNNTTNNRIKELEIRIEDLERKIAIERTKKNIGADSQEIHNYYLEALKLDPFMLINYIVKGIKVYSDKVEIIFNNRIKISPNDKGFLFYSNLEKMKKIVQNRVEPKTLKIKVEIYV